MDVSAIVDNVLREQVDKGNVIETLWLLFAAHMQIPPRGTQWRESRRCFFTGANLLFECIMRRRPTPTWREWMLSRRSCNGSPRI